MQTKTDRKPLNLYGQLDALPPVKLAGPFSVRPSRAKRQAADEARIYKGLGQIFLATSPDGERHPVS